MTEEPLVRVRNMTVDYGSGRSRSRAVDRADFDVRSGETVGLVGESGSGKSTIAKALVNLVPLADGEIVYDGRDIVGLPRAQRRALSSDIQIVFQDPYSTFNPSRTIGQSLREMLLPHGTTDAAAATARAEEMLDRVGMPTAAMAKQPREFSGGQRQRLAIARALMVRPRFLICDEAVSALDLSIQAQVINLLADLQAEMNLSVLFISHDLSVVRHMSHRVVVLYRGAIVEVGDAASLYRRPLHPYTRALVDAVPVPDPVAQRERQAVPVRRVEIQVAGADQGCRYAPRCLLATEVCRSREPELETVDGGRQVACYHPEPNTQVRED